METMEITDQVGTAGHDYAGRLERLWARMGEHGVDYLFVGPSADLYYLTGLSMHSSERMSVLLLGRDGSARMVAPYFETVGFSGLPAGIEPVPWQETDDPAKLIGAMLGGGSGETAAVGDQLWSVFLLRLQNALPGIRFTEASEVLVPLRMEKDPYEVELLRAAGRAGDETFAEIRKLRFAGRTERQVAADIAAMLRERGVTAIEWGPIVGSGPNGANPHHSAGDRVIQEGDLVVLDFGGPVNHYQLDMTRTVAVGREPQGEMREVYELVRETQERAVRAARPGMSGEELDGLARGHFTQRGYGDYFIHRLGHGLGLDSHEPPYIVQGNSQPLAAGNAFSVEPGLYLPGRFGVRIEDIVVLTEHGAERMNNAPREIVVVE